MTGEINNPTQAGDFGWNFQDTVGDSSGSGDIKEVKTRTHDGVFDIQITYENNVESNDVQGWVLIDSDQNIATGFTNNGEVPPSFGIDYRLEYTTGPMLGTLASLKMENKETDTPGYTSEYKGIPIGMPYNDAMFIASGNQVFFRLPLRLLNSDDGKVSLAIDSFPVKDFSGKIEKVPELQEGALDTGTGGIRPLLVFTENPIVVDDPAGDSTGFGYDGDDLTSIEAGYSENILLLKITYTELKITDGAITTVSFDTDQNAEQVSEYVVSYSFYNGELGAQIFGEKEGKYGMYPAGNLISKKGNSVYLSVPLEFLQDEGNMDVYVETTLVSSKARIPPGERGKAGDVDISPNKFENSVYDRLPDTGSISISKEVEQNKNTYETSGKDTTFPGQENENQNPESPGPGTVITGLSLLASLGVLKWKGLRK